MNILHTHFDIHALTLYLSSKVCIKIKTGGADFNEGYLDVFVNNGTSGYIEVTTKDLYAKNETVLDDVCYDAFLGIQVTSNNTNAWVGSIMSSVDNGETYLPMKCEDCTGSTASTASIVVDGNADGINLAPAQCLDGQIGYPGNNCTLVNVVSLDCSIFIHPMPFAQLSLSSSNFLNSLKKTIQSSFISDKTTQPSSA